MAILDICIDALAGLEPVGLPIGQIAISKFLTGYASDSKSQTKALRLLELEFFMRSDGSAIAELVQSAIAKRIRVLGLTPTAV